MKSNIFIFNAGFELSTQNAVPPAQRRILPNPAWSTDTVTIDCNSTTPFRISAFTRLRIKTKTCPGVGCSLAIHPDQWWCHQKPHGGYSLVGSKADSIAAAKDNVGWLMNGYTVCRAYPLRLRCWAHLKRKANGLAEWLWLNSETNRTRYSGTSESAGECHSTGLWRAKSENNR